MTSIADASDQPPPPEAGRRPAPDAADTPASPAGDAGAADARLDRGPAAALLAELALHRGMEPPFSLGLFGPAGSGKSHFLGDLLGAVRRLAAAAGREAGTSPFASRVVLARIAAAPGREPAGRIVSGVLDALAEGHAAFAEEAIHAGSDPREAARLAGERVNALRRELDAERQTLDELGLRRARLTETVLFEGAGSRLDAFARANRARIEARLKAFGLPASDPLRSFKELVRDGAEPGGSGSRLGLTLRAIWGYKGQGALVVLAVVLVVLGWAAGGAADDPAPLTAWLAGFGDRFAAVTDWARGHLDLLQPLSHIAFALAALALLAVAIRAARFLSPLYRGIALLKNDLAARRRDLDGLLAHQTRRVDGLAAEAETASQGAEAAQRRAEGRRGTGLSDHGAALAADLFGLARTPAAAAEAFLARLGDAMAAGAEGAPERLVVALDGLDGLGPAELADLLGTTHRLLARPGIVGVIALEREAAAAALGEFDPAGAAARLDRIVQFSYDLAATAPDPALMAERLLERRSPAAAEVPKPEASRSVLDRAFEPFETALLKRLAGFTGGTPRRVRRFVDVYRVARADPRLVRAAPASLAMLALGLALDGTGAGSEIAGFDESLGRGKVAVEQGSEVGRAFATAMSILGTEVAVGDLRRGLAVARSYTRHG